LRSRGLGNSGHSTAQDTAYARFMSWLRAWGLLACLGLAAAAPSCHLILSGLQRPEALLWHQGLYVAEAGAGRILFVGQSQLPRILARGLKDPQALALGPQGRLWVGLGDGSLGWLSKGHLVLAGKVPDPYALAFVGSTLWVASYSQGVFALPRRVPLYPSHGGRAWVARLLGPSHPLAMVLEGGNLWVAWRNTALLGFGGGAVLEYLHPHPGSPPQVGVSFRVPSLPLALAVSGERIWVALADGQILQVGGPEVHLPSPTALAWGGGRLWVATVSQVYACRWEGSSR